MCSSQNKTLTTALLSVRKKQEQSEIENQEMQRWQCIFSRSHTNTSNLISFCKELIFPLTTENCISIHQHTIAVSAQYERENRWIFIVAWQLRRRSFQIMKKKNLFCEDKKEKFFRRRKKFLRKFSSLLTEQKGLIKAETRVKSHRKSMEDEGNWFWASD